MSGPGERPLRGTELKRLHRHWRRHGHQRLSLLLDGVQTPFNVGSILRTAAAYRVDRLWLAGPTASPTDAKTRKTSLGSERYLSWERVESGAEGAARAKDSGYQVVAVELTATARPMHELDLAPDTCLVLGHEERGVSPATIAACDLVGFIPQLGRIGSLNVAVAAALGIYEVRRQSWTSPGGSHP